MPTSRAQVEDFMHQQQVAAFCTVDVNHKPHAVPVWFTYGNDKVYVQTDRVSVKVHNLLKNPNVAVEVHSGEFGEEAVIIRGKAKIVGEDEFVIRTQEHIDKYHIQLDEEGRDSMGIRCFDNTIRCVIEVSVDRLIFW
jgi:nitroimidazol reductase NimA-like FMN-containing flavoprotein (pyridoxamine 5'-phosphate oxidase superfamily)